MKTTYSKIFIWIVLLICQIGKAQESVFAFAYDVDGQSANSKNTTTNYKLEVIQSVFDDLIEAKGVFNMPKPDVELVNSTQMPAFINLKEGKVIIEEKAYDICASLGKDSLSAISVLLSHELTHYYEKHDWRNNFLHFYKSSMKKSDNGAALAYEIQADQLGGFLSNMAGYNTTGVLEPLLTKIYTDYNISKAANSHYPSLQERIALANESEKRLKNMNYAFNMSGLLAAVGAYDPAYKYLEYIVSTGGFQSREIYNNQAVLLMLAALPLYSSLEMPLVLPIEYDFESRLGRRSNQNKRAEILVRAEEILNSSLNLDKDYLPALLNMSVLYILKEDYFEAKYRATKLQLYAEKANDKVHQAQAKQVLSIIAYMQGDKLEAIKHLDDAEAIYPNDIIAYNKSIIKNTGNTTRQNKKSQAKKLNADTGLNKLFSKLMRDELSAKNQIEIDKKNLFFKVKDSGHEVMINMNDYGEGGCHFFQNRSSINLSGTEVNLKSNKKEVEALIGEPDHEFYTASQIVSHYEIADLIVKYDTKAKVVSLIHYHEER